MQEPSDPIEKTAGRRSRPAQRFFLRGLITALPAVFTVLILVTAYRLVEQHVSGPVNAVIHWGLESHTLGWNTLRTLGVNPYDDEFLMPSALPRAPHDHLRVIVSGGVPVPQAELTDFDANAALARSRTHVADADRVGGGPAVGCRAHEGERERRA